MSLALLINTVYLIWKMPFMHDFFNRLHIFGSLFVLICTATSWLAAAADNENDTAALTYFVDANLALFGFWLIWEALLAWHLEEKAGSGDLAIAHGFTRYYQLEYNKESGQFTGRIFPLVEKLGDKVVGKYGVTGGDLDTDSDEDEENSGL